MNTIKEDANVSRGIASVFKSIFRWIIVFLGFVNLMVTIASLFEYKEGIYDLSLFEIIALISFLYLFRRYYRICKSLQYSWRKIYSIPLMVYGWLLLFKVVIFVIMVSSHSLSKFEVLDEPAGKIFELLIICLVVYFSTPKKTKILEETDEKTKDKSTLSEVVN